MNKRNRLTERPVLALSGIIGLISLFCMVGGAVMVHKNLFLYGAIGVLQFMCVFILAPEKVEVGD